MPAAFALRWTEAAEAKALADEALAALVAGSSCSSTPLVMAAESEARRLSRSRTQEAFGTRAMRVTEPLLGRPAVWFRQDETIAPSELGVEMSGIARYRRHFEEVHPTFSERL
jgi:hypothetical protein